jgi:hypothetical protein
MSLDYFDALHAALEEPPEDVASVAWGKAGERIGDVIATSYGFLWRGGEAGRLMEQMIRTITARPEGFVAIGITDNDARAINTFMPGNKAPRPITRQAVLIDFAGDPGIWGPMPDHLLAWGRRTGNVRFPRGLAIERATQRKKLVLADAVA